MTTSLNNPRKLLRDPKMTPFEQDQYVDLLAGNVPTIGTGKYVCFSYKVPKGSVLVVKGLAPYAMSRVNPGTNDEYVEMIEPKKGNGQFFFEPRVNDGVPDGAVLGADVAALRTVGQPPAIANLNNKDRARATGFTSLSIEPRRDAHFQWVNELYGFVVPSNSVFKVVFSIIPQGSASPLPSDGRFQVGLSAVKRVDFAGAVVVGHQLPAQAYDELARQVREGGK